jgi:DNA repair exonuclease SbcCD ATPase subunit
MAEFIEFLSQNALAELQLANKELVTMVSNVDKVGQKMKGITTPSGSDSAIKSLSEQYKQQEKVIQSLQNQLQKLNETRKTSTQRTSEEIVNQRALAQASDRQARATSGLVGAYANLNAKHQQAKKTLQDLIASQTASAAQIRKAQKEYDALDKRVMSADRAVRSFNRNVGNYPQQAAMGIKNLMSAFGVFGGIYLFAGAVKDAFKTVKDFDKANADLAATMGKSRKEISSLTNDQKRLGASTKFTATEVAGLQKEYAKLGFSQKEILNATEATLSLAAAVDTDLANASMVAGSTLRGFGLDASEMQRVVDVMAKSFTASALDIENFRESMKYVAPIARASGVSIEFTTAMLGKLADSGIKGSQAGTSLRRILAEMAKTGLPAAQALDKVAKSGISVNDAMDEVGRTAQTALLVLSKSKDGINDLKTALDEAAGAAKAMADEQLNSLQGKLTLLSSAWDGFILSLQSGDGMLSNFFKGAIDKLTSLLNLISEINKSRKEFNNEILNKGYSDATKNVFDYAKSVADAGKERFKTEKEYLDRIREIELQDADFRKKITIERLKSEEKKYNEAIQLLKTYEKNAKGIFGALGLRSLSKQKDNVKALEANISSLMGEIDAYNAILGGTTQIQEKENIVVDDNTKATKKNTQAKKENEILTIGSAKWIKEQISQLKEINDTLSTTSEEYQTGLGAIKFYEQWLERLTGTAKKTAEELDGISLDLGGAEFITDADGDKLKEEGDKLREILKEFKQSFMSEFADQSGFGKMLDLLNGGLDKFEGDAVSTALAVSEAFQEAFNTISSFSNANYENMYSNLEQQRDVAILFAGESTTAREEIESQYEARRKRIQKQQAESQKRMAMFNIAMNTAQGIVSALAMLPPNIPLSIAIGAIGAVQLAMVASQPIPAFEKGGIHDGGLMLVNDGKGSNYSEKVVTPDGKVHEPKGRNVVMNAPKGTQIFTHDQWQEQMNSILLGNGINPLKEQQQRNDVIVNVETKDNYHFSIDEGGINKTIIRGNAKTNILNSRLRIKSNNV